jgi:hypothetical protein
MKYGPRRAGADRLSPGRAWLREKERIMKLPLAVVFVLALVTAGTGMFCLSGVVTPRDTEYGGVRAVFHHYLGAPGEGHPRGPSGMSGLSR